MTLFPHPLPMAKAPRSRNYTQAGVGSPLAATQGEGTNLGNGGKLSAILSIIGMARR